jgi:hypothetical protein
MKRLAFALGALALGFAATTAARADYAIVMFKSDGHCQVWNETLKPLAPGWKYHWVHLKNRDVAMTKKHYAMTHHWCKSFN